MITDPLSAVDLSELPLYTEQFMSAEYNRQFELRNPVTKIEGPRSWWDLRDMDLGLFAKATSYMSGPGSAAFHGVRQWELKDVEDPGPFNGITYFKEKYAEYKANTPRGAMYRNVFMKLNEMDKLTEPSGYGWMETLGQINSVMTPISSTYDWLFNQVPSSPELIDALVMDGMEQQEELVAYYNMMERLPGVQRYPLYGAGFIWQLFGDPTNLLAGIGLAKMGYKGLRGIEALNKTGTRKIITAMAAAGTFNLAYEQVINEMNPATELEGSINEWWAAGLGVLLGGGLAGVGHAATTGRLGKVTPGWNWNRTRIGIKRMAHADNQRSELLIRKVDEFGNPIESMGAAPELSTMKGALIEAEGDMNIMLKNRYGEGDIVHVSYLKPADNTHPVNMAARKLRAKAKEEGWHLQELEHPDQRIIEIFERFDDIMSDPNWQAIATRSELDYGITSKVLGQVNEKYARLQSMVNPGARQAFSTHRVVNDMYRALSGSAHTITRASAKNPLGSKRGVTAEGYTHLLRDRTMKVTEIMSRIYKEARRLVKKGKTGINYDGDTLKMPWLGGQTEFEEAVNNYIRRRHSVKMGMHKTVPDDVHPLIIKAAKEVEAYYKAMGKELVEAGLLDADNILLAQYLPISYSSKKIRANPDAFVEDMAMAFRNKQRLVDGKMLDSDDLIPVDPVVVERMNSKAGRDLFDGVEAKNTKDITPEAANKLETDVELGQAVITKKQPTKKQLEIKKHVEDKGNAAPEVLIANIDYALKQGLITDLQAVMLKKMAERVSQGKQTHESFYLFVSKKINPEAVIAEAPMMRWLKNAYDLSKAGIEFNNRLTGVLVKQKTKVITKKQLASKEIVEDKGNAAPEVLIANIDYSLKQGLITDLQAKMLRSQAERVSQGKMSLIDFNNYVKQNINPKAVIAEIPIRTWLQNAHDLSKDGIEFNNRLTGKTAKVDDVVAAKSKVDDVAREELGNLEATLRDDPDGVQLTTGPAEPRMVRANPEAQPHDVGMGGYPGTPAKSLRYGDETTVLFADNVEVPAYYAFIEADELRPSNNPLGPKTSKGGFPKDPETGDWNHRANDYADPTGGSNSIKTNNKIVQDPNLKVFYDRGSGTQMGPPVISATGYPDSGTNRVMAIQRLYAGHGNAKRPGELRQAAVTNAADFGIDPSVVSKMKQPVLVKVMKDPKNPGEYSSASNLHAAAAESVMSDAVTRGSKINTSTLDTFGRMFDDAGDDVTLNSILNNPTNSKNIRDKLLDSGAWRESDLAHFWSETQGTMTARGKENVQNMLMSRVLEAHNDAHPFKMGGDQFPNRVAPASVLLQAGNKARNNLEAAVPEILQIIRMGEEGRLPEAFSETAQLIKSTLSRALIADAELAKAGKTTLSDHFFNQAQLGDIKPFTGSGNFVIATLVNALRTQGTRTFRKNMRNWMRRIERAQDDAQMGIPGAIRREYWKLDKELKTKWNKVDEGDIPAEFMKRFNEAEAKYLEYEGDNIWQSFIEEMGGLKIPTVAKHYKKVNQPAGDHMRLIKHEASQGTADLGTYKILDKKTKKVKTKRFETTFEKYWTEVDENGIMVRKADPDDIHSRDADGDRTGLSTDPKRLALQKTWAKEIMELEELTNETLIGPGRGGGKVRGGDVENGSQITFITGAAASGKSTFADAALRHFKANLLDADIAKRKLPEFLKHQDQATTITHVESQRITQYVYQQLLEQKRNLVYPKIGSHIGDISILANMARDAGYDVHIMTVDLPLTDIVDRSIHRWGHSGRLVPLDISAGRYGRRSLKIHNKMREDGVIKAQDWWGDTLTDVKGNKISDIPLKSTSHYDVAMSGEVPFSLNTTKGPAPELRFNTKSGTKRAVDNRVKSEYNIAEGVKHAEDRPTSTLRTTDERGTPGSRGVRTDGESGVRTDADRRGLEQRSSDDGGIRPVEGTGRKWRDVTEGDLPPNLREAYRRQLTQEHTKHAQSVRDSVMDPLSSGGVPHAMSPHLRKRTLGIDYDDVINWTDNEITRPMMRYDHKISGEIGIRRAISSNPDIFNKYRLPGGGKVKTPEDLRTIVDNEFNVMAEIADRGGDSRTADKIHSLRNKVSRDLFLPMDALRGKNPGNAAVVDPDSFMSFFGRTIQRYNFMNKLGSVAWAQLNDIAPITLYMISRPSTIKFIPRALGIIKDLPHRDLEVLGLWADKMYRTRSINDFDFNVLDYGFGGGRTRKISAAIEQGSAKIADISGRISGMNFVTNANKRLAAMLTLDKINVISKKMIRADKLVKGGMPIGQALRKVRLSRFRAAKVNQMGLDVNSAIHYHTQLYNHGVMNDGVTSIKSMMSFDSYMKNEKGFFNPNFEAWSSNPGNKSLLDTIHSRINDEVNRHLVVTPGVYDRPLINFNTWGKMFNQFQTFMTAFLHQRMIPMAQMPAQNQLWYMGMYLMIGSITDGITNHLSGRRNFSETIEQWEKNPQGMMYKAWIYSGISGPINRLFGITDALGVAISPGVALKNRVGGGASQGFYWGDPGTKTVVQSLGPTGSTASTVTDVMYDLIGAGEIDETTAYRAATLAPFQNQAILRALYRTTGLPVVPEAIREKK